MKRKLLIISALCCFVFGENYGQNALNFDGINDYIQSSFMGISGSNARTVEARIRTTANAATTQQVITDWGAAVSSGRFTFNISTGNAIRLEVQGSGISGTKALNDGQWHHVAVVYDPAATKKVSLYVDGTLDASGNLTTLVNTYSSTGLRIGQRVDGASKFQGSIAEVRIWNVARTPQDILDNKDKQFCSTQSNLIAYYKLNQGKADGNNSSVTTATDSSGNNYNGNLLNFALNSTTSNWVAGATLNPIGLDKTITYNKNGTLTANQINGSYQWLDCYSKVPIANATANSYTPITPGIYGVEVSWNGCIGSSDCIRTSSLGIEDPSNGPKIKLYPNPTTDILNIDLGEINNTVKARLVSITGQLIKNQTFSDISTFSMNIDAEKGVYFLQIDSDQLGTQVFKIIKN